MKSGDIVKIIKVAYPFIKKDSLGKISRLIIKNNKFYLEDLKVYVSDKILTTDLDYQIDYDNCSIITETEEDKFVTINDSIISFIKRIEDGEEITNFEKLVELYGKRLLELIENKDNPKWIEILNEKDK
jgi:hypothetical protein